MMRKAELLRDKGADMQREKETTSTRPATRGEKVTYASFLFLEGVLRLFPMAFWYLFGRFIGWVAFFILPHYQRRIRHNLRIILGSEASPEAIRRLTRENFQTVLCNFITAAKAATMSDKALASHYVIKGKENIQNSLKEKGKGVICVISHMGNWELLARIRADFQEVPRFGSMYRELDNILMERLWLKRRECSGCEMIGKKKSSFTVSTQILRDNGMLGILCDQNAGNMGVIVPYFGKRTPTTNLPALLQRRTGAAVHPTTVRTIGLGKWEVAFGEEIEIDNKGKDMAATTAKINHVLAGIGRQSVRDGFWLHNRWKMGLFTIGHEPVISPPVEYGKPCYPLRLLLIVPDKLAEGLFLLPFLRACCDFRDDCEWNILCPKDQMEFWSACADVYSVRELGGNVRRQIIDVNEESDTGLDAAFVFNADTSLIPLLKGVGCMEIRSIAGDNEALRGWRNATDSSEKWLTHRMSDICKAAHVWGVEIDPAVYYPSLREEKPGEEAVVYLAPFSEYGGTEEWENGKWKEFVSCLSFPCRVIALPGDREHAEVLAAEAGVPLDICTPEEALLLLGNARLLVGLDGVLPGLAAFAGTPAVTMYVNRLPNRWSPPGAGEKSLYGESPLSGLSPATLKEVVLEHLTSLGWE